MTGDRQEIASNRDKSRPASQVKSMMLTDAGPDEPLCPYLSRNTYYTFSITFNIILRSISGTGSVGSVVIFNILEHPEIVKSRLK